MGNMECVIFHLYGTVKNYAFHIPHSGHFVFAVLFALAWWFWPERTLILDAAFQSYLFVATGQPAIMVERFGAAAVQALPLAAVHAGAPLGTVLAWYSVSFVLFQYALFLVALKVLKSNACATCILLFNVLLAGDCFYWMQNELLQGISLMFVLWALWLRRGDALRLRWRFDVPALLLAVTVVYLHPLIVFPLAYVWCFFWLHPQRLLSRRFLWVAAAVLVLIWLTKYIFRQPNFYDRGMTGQYLREFNLSPSRFWHAQSLRDLALHCTGSMALWLPLLALLTVFYLRKKKLLPLGLLFGFSLGYVALIVQRFLDDDRWYIQESHYQALAVFLLAPLVWDVLPQAKNRRRLGLFIAIVLVFRLFGIYQTHTPYTRRLAYVSELLERTQVRKGILDAAAVQRQTLLMNWGLPFETLQVSALESPDSVRVLVIADDSRLLERQLERSRDSMVSFLMIPKIAFHDWPARYYRMADTTAWQLSSPVVR